MELMKNRVHILTVVTLLERLAHFIGFPATVDGVTYFNVGYTPKLISQLRGVKPEEIAKSVDRYDIFLYELKGDHFDIFSPDQKFIRAAIKAGKIKGKDSKIDDTRENLIKFIKSSGKKLFPRKFRYTRVKDAAPAKKPAAPRKTARGKAPAKAPVKSAAAAKVALVQPGG